MPVLEPAAFRLFSCVLSMLDSAATRLGKSAEIPPHLALGIRGEETAFFYLHRMGYTITSRSWRSHRYAGDIDLIGWDADCLCFIEVKTRTTRDVASAESAVDEHKRKTLRKMARHYLRQNPSVDNFRFDVLAIYFEKETGPEFILFKNAFGWSELSPY